MWSFPSDHSPAGIKNLQLYTLKVLPHLNNQLDILMTVPILVKIDLAYIPGLGKF
jgi:hypothetical protein